MGSGEKSPSPQSSKGSESSIKNYVKDGEQSGGGNGNGNNNNGNNDGSNSNNDGSNSNNNGDNKNNGSDKNNGGNQNANNNGNNSPPTSNNNNGGDDKNVSNNGNNSPSTSNNNNEGNDKNGNNGNNSPATTNNNNGGNNNGENNNGGNNANNNNNNNNQNNNGSPVSGNNTGNNVQAPPVTRGGGLAPPPPKQLRGSSKSPSKDSSPSGLSHDQKVAAIASIGAVAGLLFFFMIICLVCVCKKKKKRERMYYGDPHGGGGYYQSATYGTQNWQGGNDHAINLPPPPNGANSYGAPPQNHTPPNMSSDMSSSYSGPYGPALPPPPPISLGMNQSEFSYEELVAATSNFSQANLLGQGGFGYVHKGVLPNGKEIAVKSLKSGSGQGDREFQAEVEIISRVHHRYLVSLVGYCISNGQKMLVYEFVTNNTLEHHLYRSDASPLDWPSRLKIALGSAKGLAYLHEDCHPKIIHRDIKASNILLDNSFEAKVADFGLAKLSADNYTHVSTRVMGTFGYLAPEYASSGKLTEKSDVFSFGVMLLELITGRRPIDLTGNSDDSLVDWARPLCVKALEEDDYEALADPRLEGKYIPHEMARMVASAAASIRHSAKKRPKMSQIVRALEGDVSLEDLNEGMKLGQSGASTSSSSDYDTGSYNEDMKKFRKMAMGISEELRSKEY